MKNSTKKLFVSSLALAFAAATTISTSYAWFTMQTTATVSNIELNVTSGEGFTIAFGDNASTADYKQTLTIADFNAAYSGYLASLVMDQATSPDGEKIYTKSNAVISKTENKYLEFQLNFKGAKKYNIFLTNTETYGYSLGKAIKANSVLAVKGFTESITDTSITASKAAYIARTKSETEIVENSLIYAFSADAARLSIQDLNSANKQSTKTLKFAVNGQDYGDNLSLANNNLALKYYNYITGENADVPTDSNKPIDPVHFSAITNQEVSDNVLTKMENSFNGTEEFVASIKIRIWLEGWDADCFNAILSDKLNFGLSFEGRVA